MHDLRLRTYAAGGAMAPHSHEESSFTVVLEGSYRESVRGRDLEHGPGAMLFYPAGETHSQAFGPTGSLKLIFQPSTFCLDLLHDGKVPLGEAPFLQHRSVKQLASRAARELRSSDTFSRMIVEGTLLELVAVFGRRHSTKQREGSAIPGWLKQCRELLEQQPGVAVTHESLAAGVKKHPVHLAKAFRKAYGETIGDCQRRLRLQKAKLLLLKPEIPLAEVALECGFADQAHFCRTFKAAFGTTPRGFQAFRR